VHQCNSIYRGQPKVFLKLLILHKKISRNCAHSTLLAPAAVLLLRFFFFFEIVQTFTQNMENVGHLTTFAGCGIFTEIVGLSRKNRDVWQLLAENLQGHVFALLAYQAVAMFCHTVVVIDFYQQFYQMSNTYLIKRSILF
jgi:hypothetical protein